MAKIYRPKLPFGTLFFEVEADYDQEMKQTLQKVGNCDCDDFSFEMKRSGKQKRLLYLIPFFNQGFYFFEAKQKIRELSLEQGRIEDLLALKSDYEKQLRYFPKIVIEIGTTWGGEGQERAVYLSAYPNGIFLKQCSLGSKLQSSNSCSYVLAVHHNESLFFSVFNQYQYSAPHK